MGIIENAMTGFVPHLGAVVADHGVTFRTWAPAQETVRLVMEDGATVPMTREANGFFVVRVPDIQPGQRYWYQLREGLRPDPASRFQPEGPTGPSQVVDPRSYRWGDSAWPGAPETHRHVFYELHIGTFTQEGTWQAATRRLPELAAMGITTIEVMPIAEFSGRFGWGYDGVDLFAPSRLYGSPDDARRFVDTAHQAGLAVILDVVYNHFGPVGNFLRDFAPAFFGKPGEWGDSINYDGADSGQVRAFVIENAAYWIAEYHFDGLRFDATHGIHDSSPRHIIAEMCEAARRAAGSRRVFLVGESEPQDTRLLKDHGSHHDGLDAIWNEDWHHSAYVALTGRRQAYFTDYQGTASEFAAMARHGTLFQGQWYSWQKQARGGYAFGLPSSCFVTFLENHDQVANTGLGWRLYHHTDGAKWRAITTLLLAGPQLPLLFQGQEFASTQPFTYFADHEGEIGEAVSKGRLEFLAQFPELATPAVRARIARPDDEAAYQRCKLAHEDKEADKVLHSWAVALHRDLLHLRRSDPVLSRVGTADVVVESSAPSPFLVFIRYVSGVGQRLVIVNLNDDVLSAMNDPLLAPPPGARWELLWSSDHPDYGGTGSLPLIDDGRWLLRGHAAVIIGSVANG